MSIEEFTIALFVRIDETMKEVQRHPRALLAPSEIVTLALLFVFKGVSLRRFHAWVRANLSHLFPGTLWVLPERSRLHRLFATHRDWADVFLADITPEAICDSLGIELVHPRREGRSQEQVGTKGLSNKRWIVGIKIAPILSENGLVCHPQNVGTRQCRPANEHHPLCGYPTLSRDDCPTGRHSCQDGHGFSWQNGRSAQSGDLWSRRAFGADVG